MVPRYSSQLNTGSTECCDVAYMAWHGSYVNISEGKEMERLIVGKSYGYIISMCKLKPVPSLIALHARYMNA